jgi:hypothetical protein
MDMLNSIAGFMQHIPAPLCPWQTHVATERVAAHADLDSALHPQLGEHEVQPPRPDGLTNAQRCAARRKMISHELA